MKNCIYTNAFEVMRCRWHLRLSQKKAADAIGVGFSTLCNAERGFTPINIKTAQKIAAFYGVPISSLINDERTAEAELWQAERERKKQAERERRKALQWQKVDRRFKHNYYPNGELLRNLRIEKHLTGKQVADALGVHFTHLYHIESNGVKVAPATMKKIADFYDRPLDELIIEKNEVEYMKPKRLWVRKSFLVNGEKLKKLRLDKKIRLQKAAEKIGISLHTLFYIEQGTARASERTIEKISQFYGILPEEFIIKD